MRWTGTFRRLSPLLLLWGSILRPAWGAELTLSLKTDRERIYLGESFILHAEVQGSRNLPNPPDLSELPEAEITLLGSRDNSFSRVRIVNGRFSREQQLGRTYFYQVKPRRSGIFRAGPVSLPGANVRSEGPRIQVVGIQTQDLVVAEIAASETTVLVDAPFHVTLRVAVAALPEPHTEEPLSANHPPHLQADYLQPEEIEGLKTPDIMAVLRQLVSRNSRQPSFTINDYRSRGSFGGNLGLDLDSFFEPHPIPFRLPGHRVRRDNRDYWEYELEMEYTPRREGDYIFGPLTFKGPIIAVDKASGRFKLREIFTIGPAVTVRVVPPPEQGRPEWFIGAVGRDMTAKAEFDTSVCKVGDPLMLTIEVGGEISRDNLRPPLLSLQPGMPEHFRIYDENVASETLPNGKRFTYRVRPLRGGTLEFPPIKLAYYDIDRKVYATVTTEPLPLQAQATTQIATLPGDDEGEEEALLQVGDTFRPDGILSPTATLPLSPIGPDQPLLAGLLVLPPLAWLSLWLSQQLWRRRKQWLAGLRRVLAYQRLRRDLAAAAGKMPVAPERTAAESTRALREYLATRIGPNIRNASAATLSQYLRRAGLQDAETKAFEQIWDRLERLPFQPGPLAASEVDPLLTRLGALLPDIDRALRRRPRKKSRASLVLLSGWLGFCALQVAAIPPDFGWEQANRRLATADSHEEFLEAARLYHRLSLQAPPSGVLFYNLGVALLLAEDAANAEAALLRAERYLGGKPELYRNLRLALAMRRGQPDAQLPPSRLLLAWHFGFSLHLRIVLGLTGWLLLWGGLLLRLCTRSGRRRHGAPTATRSFSGLLALTGALMFALYGASVGVTLQQEHHDRRIWSQRLPMHPNSIHPTEEMTP